MSYVPKASLPEDLCEKAPAFDCPRCGVPIIHAIEIGRGARRTGISLEITPDIGGKWIILGFVRGLIGDHLQIHAEQLKNIHDLPDTNELPQWAIHKRWHNHAYLCGMSLGNALESIFDNLETQNVKRPPRRDSR